MDDSIKTILEKFPFLSYGILLEVPYLGIIQNCDSELLSMYIFDMVPPELRKEFLELGENWWWQSNRQLPIDIFIKDKFKIFRPYLRHFSRRDFDLKSGHLVSLQEMITKRVRRRQITLVKKS